jgi:glycerol-3-phosphate cytidylyltransferase
LRNAKSRCDHLIVVVLSDNTLVRTKKKQPIITLEDRLAIVQAICYVDEVDVTTRELLGKVKA